MTIKFVNCTPHVVAVKAIGGNIVEFPPSGNVIRVHSCSVGMPDLESSCGNVFSIAKNTFGIPEGIPEPEDGVLFIVSAIVLANSDRIDLVRPDTGPTAVRENGHIQYVMGFCQDL